MSTNFYIKKIPRCPQCEHRLDDLVEVEQVHIGKRFVGRKWIFDLAYPDSKSWKKAITKTHNNIVDDFGREYTPQEMIAIIDEETFDLNVKKEGHVASSVKHDDGYYFSKYEGFS